MHTKLRLPFDESAQPLAPENPRMVQSLRDKPPETNHSLSDRPRFFLLLTHTHPHLHQDERRCHPCSHWPVSSIRSASNALAEISLVFCNSVGSKPLLSLPLPLVLSLLARPTQNFTRSMQARTGAPFGNWQLVRPHTHIRTCPLISSLPLCGLRAGAMSVCRSETKPGDEVRCHARPDRHPHVLQPQQPRMDHDDKLQCGVALH